jgi:hypothetical protein
VACTLSPQSASDRVEEWQALFARWNGAGVRTGSLLLRIRLDASTQAREEVVDLARRETACCAFFEFSVENETESLWLSVRVPLDASTMLDEFAGLLPSPS